MSINSVSWSLILSVTFKVWSELMQSCLFLSVPLTVNYTISEGIIIYTLRLVNASNRTKPQIWASWSVYSDFSIWETWWFEWKQVPFMEELRSTEHMDTLGGTLVLFKKTNKQKLFFVTKSLNTKHVQLNWILYLKLCQRKTNMVPKPQ